jgi:hypothetical protein
MNPWRIVLGLLPVVVLGCSGTTPASSSQEGPACIKPSMNYRSLWVEQGSACGKAGPKVFRTKADGSWDPQTSTCTGTIAENGCTEVFTNYTCVDLGGDTETLNGTMTWAADGLTASGTIERSTSRRARNGSPCKATYSVTYEPESRTP